MRKLASIQKVREVRPIEGADRIELAMVMGWQCVVNKGVFSPGDKAVYFEIDSFLPIRNEFEFLRKSSYRNDDFMGEGFRLKTMKMRGQLSQGLLLPLEDFPEIGEAEIGTDVTELLGVRKWEMEERATTGGTIVGGLPYDIPHTDETRIQNVPEIIGEFEGKEYYITTKMDGSSHSIGIDRDGFHVTGHNYEYKDDGKSSFYEFVKNRGYRERMEQYAEENGLREFTVQGEYCGGGIQKNRLKLKAPEWYVFTIRENGKRVGLMKMLDICEALGFASVPVEEVSECFPEKYPTVESLLERANGQYPNGGPKEGVVVRPVEPVYSDKVGDYLSVKIINNKYLLKNEK